MGTILIVEDDAPFRARIGKAFERRGYSVTLASGVEQGRMLARELKPDFALVDLNLGGESGLELLSTFQSDCPQTKVTILTGYGSVATTVSALKSGAHHYLTKPASFEEILSSFGIGAQDSSGERIENPAYPTLSQVEWDYIQKILLECGGNITQAAKQLGIHRRSLQRKLSKRPETLS